MVHSLSSPVSSLCRTPLKQAPFLFWFCYITQCMHNTTCVCKGKNKSSHSQDFFLTLLKHKSSINMSCGKTSPLETGEMPVAALRDQLHLASLLFLMCSAYKTMSHHTNPDAFYTLSSVFLSSGLGLYIPPSVSDFTPKSPASVLNGQVGVPLIFSYCFLLTQRGTERKQTEASDTVPKVLSVTVTLYFAIVLWCSDINA